MSSQPTTPPGSRVFVGREAELRTLEAALLPVEGGKAGNQICVISGMPGVGKSYLVEQFVQKWQASLPPSPKIPPVPVVMPWGESKFSPPVQPQPGRLVHLENVDNERHADNAVQFIRRFSWSTVIITG